ncbi:hypothetical protein NLI96_g12960 [Meripilus lineatus]|uniref:Integrase core domain-containing protein n=1 Tax=Meripilus lineatus TaxID=2056292 RepID=A0AAD5UQP2_9APHY|nr:hypothetical protein NLI96_g12960 [Physisporinus lineatus]
MSQTSESAPLPLRSIHQAFELLKHDVRRACHTQVGNQGFLQSQIQACLRFEMTVNQHQPIIPAEDVRLLRQSVGTMISDLEEAMSRSADEPDIPEVLAVTRVHTGRRGRPRIEIDPSILAEGIQYGSSRLGRSLDVSARTVRRRAVEANIVDPGIPVYVEFHDTESGQTYRWYTSSTGLQSVLTDDELDGIMLELLNSFPTFGRRMIEGHFLHLGHNVPRRRLQASYARINGPAISAFGVRRIQRRVYHVRAFNSLSHHDGQHGLVRWKIVFHAFIDGYS